MVLGCCSRNKTVVHFSSNPADLPTNNSENVSIKELVKNRCPSLFTPFEAPWWLNNGHIQTAYSVFADFSKADKVWYRRQFLSLADGGILGLDFAPKDDQFSDETPIVVISHGLTGGSYEPYLKCIVARAILPVERGGLGFRAVVVHHRGCGGTPVTSPTFYMANETDDLRQAFAYLSHKYPRAQLHGLGFSLGANMMTNYVAQEGERSRLWSACMLGNPWDFNANSVALNKDIIGYYVYNRALGHNAQALVKRHIQALALDDPSHPMSEAAQRLVAFDKPTLTQYDELFSRWIGGRPAWQGEGPYYPFATVEDYYTFVSSHTRINHIKVPVLAINAVDDPIVQHYPMMVDNPSPDEDSPHFIMALTSGGGHLGWFTDGSGSRWITQPVMEWLKMASEDIGWDRLNIERGPPIFVDADGWIREKGRPLLGCKEMEGGGLIDGNGGEQAIVRGL